MAETYLTPEEEARRKLLEDEQTGANAGATSLGSSGLRTTDAGTFLGAQSQAAPQAAPRPQQTVAPAPTVPPPPPPPPPAPDLGFDVGDVGGFAADWMRNVNPYATDLTRAARSESEGRLREAEGSATRGIEEWAAKRGLTGSSYEGEQQVDLAGELQRARQADELGLLDRLASAEAGGRSAAGGFALDTLQAGDVLNLDRYRAALEGMQLGEAQRQFGGTLGISQQQIDLRAQELQQQAQLEGRSLDLQAARDQATVELERERLTQSGEQFERGLTQRESEFARQFGLNEQEFGEQQRQFSAQYGEQVASRLQQDEQFRAALASEDARFAMDTGLREKALALQEQGMEMDEAYRQAALAQEGELQQRALTLQEQGMERDDAYRYAALEQDSGFRQRALDLQETGMDLDESYRRAEMEQRKEQFDAELNFRLQQAETEQERFDAIYELVMREMGLEGTGPTGINGTRYDPLGTGGGVPTIPRGRTAAADETGATDIGGVDANAMGDLSPEDIQRLLQYLNSAQA